MRRAGRLAAPLVLAAAVAAGCNELAGPTDIAALDFEGVPFPALVTGDTMRDSTGAAAPLVAIAYNGNGQPMVGAPIQYLTLDTGVAISPEGYLTATRRDGQVRLLASIAGLQSGIRTVDVTREPDTVAGPTSATINYGYTLPDAGTNVSPALALTVTSEDTVGGLSPGVKGWLVRWRIIHDGDTLGLNDTTLVALWTPGGTRRTLLDTTKAGGTSSRRLRVYANVLPSAVDSFIVVAEVRARGVQLPGSPVRFVVHVAPPAP